MDKTRQYGISVDMIRWDHVARYIYAAEMIPEGSKVLDLACGCGYGSWLLHGVGNEVTGVDISEEAIEYAKRHYKGPTYLCQKAEDTNGEWDAIVSFETLEHLDSPLEVLKAVQAPLIIASVPNEELFKFKPARFAGDEYPHKRHYTPEEFHNLLNDAGYVVAQRFCQPDKAGEIIEGTQGIFLIYIARRLNGPSLSKR